MGCAVQGCSGTDLLARADETVSGRTGLQPFFDADAMMDAALRRSGRQRFSDRSFAEPLSRLLRSYETEADLSRFGRYAARFDLMRCLHNLLRLDAAEEEHPEILDRAIEKPVFITGLPRSATSFLHKLLSLDPANVVPRCWQLIYPYPSRSRPWGADLRKAHVELQLRLFRCLAPGLDGLHALSADAPQECTDITAQIFQSLRFDNTYNIPSYQAWLGAHGHRGAFRFHRRFLQHLDAQIGGGRWVLKSPDHVFTLDAILAAYPDAQIVFLHRDPLSVVASCAKLSERLRRPFTRHIDRAEIGRQVSARLVESTARMMKAAAHSSRILHLHYRQIVSAPLEAASLLYRHCGLALRPEAEQRMRAWLARPRRRRRRYNLAEFGLDAASLREQFAPYVQAFDTGTEWRGPDEASSLAA
jgi:hypothetical protein